MRLYGRQREIATLQDALQQTDAAKSVEIVFVSGGIGTGKKSLVRCSLRPSVEAKNGYFVSGSFRQKEDKIIMQQQPAAFQEAVEDLMEIMKERGELEMFALSITAEFSERELRMLTDFFPVLLVAIEKHGGGGHPAARKTMPMFTQGNHSLQLLTNPEHATVFSRFVTICFGGSQAVLLLENLHWADDASLELIKTLLDIDNSHDRARGLLIMATYRNDTDLPEHLERFLQEGVPNSMHEKYFSSQRVDNSQVLSGASLPPSSSRDDRIRTVQLRNLDWNAVHDMVVERLGSAKAEDQTQSLTDLVFDHSAGNPLFSDCILRLLIDERNLCNQGESWMWSDSFLFDFEKKLPNTIPELFLEMISKEEPFVQTMLKTAAALVEFANRGDVMDLSVALGNVLHQPCAEAISAALERGWLQSVHGRTKFTRKEIQEAFYTLVPAPERSAFHLKLGRKLWKKCSESEKDLDANVFLITRQLERGACLVVDPEERFVIASLHLRASRKAMKASVFPVAACHIDYATSMMGDALWSDEMSYALGLAIHNVGAEAYYCIGDFEKMDMLLNGVFENAKNFDDKLQAYLTLIFANGSRHRLVEALNTAGDVLRELGAPIPDKPGKRGILVEYFRTKWALRGKKDRFFLTLPVATDEYKIAEMQILNFAFMYAYVLKPDWAAISILRLVRLSVQHGITGAALSGFSGYGFFLIAVFRDFSGGYRFGQLALGMLEQVDSKEWLARVYLGIYGFINHWAHPFRDCLEPLQLAYHSALDTGDMEGAVFTSTTHLLTALQAGTPLQDLEHIARIACYKMESLGQTVGLLHAVMFWSYVSDLSGNANGPLEMCGEISNAECALRLAEVESDKVLIGQYYFYRTVSSYLHGDYGTSLDMAKRCRTELGKVNNVVLLYEGLASLALARKLKGSMSRWKYRRRGLKAWNIFKCWARACPSNFRNKQALLGAEVAALHGRTTRALSLYSEAIEAANEEGFLDEEAQAYKLLGVYLCDIGSAFAAGPYFERARDRYLRWGATTLADCMNVQLMRSFHQNGSN